MKIERKKILIFLLVLTLAFIWGNSLLDAEHSSTGSGRVVEFLEVFFGEGNVSEHLVRKLAHFSEFALLGAELMLLFEKLPLAAAHGLFAAVTDEALQLLSDRSGEVKDILLDFSGSVCGAAFILIILLILRKADKNGQKN